MTSVKIKPTILINDRTKRIFSEIAKRSLSNLGPSKDRFTPSTRHITEDCVRGCRNSLNSSARSIEFSLSSLCSSLACKKRSCTEGVSVMDQSKNPKVPRDETSDLPSGSQSKTCTAHPIPERDQCSLALKQTKRRKHGTRRVDKEAEIGAKEQSVDGKISGSVKKQRRNRKRGNKKGSTAPVAELKTKGESDEVDQNLKLHMKGDNASRKEVVGVKNPAMVSIPVNVKQVPREDISCNERLSLNKEVFGTNAQGNTSREKQDTKLERKKTPERKQLRPNFFLAARMNSPVLKNNVRLLQENILAHDEKLEKAMIPLATLHLTLLVLHIKDVEEEDQVKQVLDACSHDLNKLFTPESSSLIFEGVGNFRDSVVFVPLANSPGKVFLYDIEKLLRKALEESGVTITDNRPFNPHLTVLKLSRNMAYFKQNNIRSIPRHLYDGFGNLEFGRDSVESILLCSMSEKNDDGFYKFLHKVEFRQQQVIDTKRNASLSESWDVILESEIVEDNTPIVPVQRDKGLLNYCTLL